MKQHRTALVIDVTKGFDGDFKERVNRLLQSVNGQNIKVDIFHFDGSNVKPGAPPTPAGTTSTVDIDAWAASQGYDQLVISKPGK